MTDARFPQTRLRRLRQEGWARRLVSENHLSVDDLIWPIFVREGQGEVEDVATMPGVQRVTIDRLSPSATSYQTPVGAEIGQTYNTASARFQLAF